MEQFTASEVVTKLRERFTSGNSIPVPDVRLTRAEFDVVVDLLEAREKAVPVVTRESAINAIEHVGRYNGPGRETEARQMLVEGSPSVVHHAQAQPAAASVTDAPVPVFSWQPIETAPKNNKRPLFLARFNDDGSLQSFDYDASWMSESESWEIPEVYFFWASANGNVEEPTHWAYQPAGFGKIEAALATQENLNG